MKETCQTWRDTVFHTMDQFCRLLEDERGEIKLPRCPWEAKEQWSKITHFKEKAEYMLRKFSRALDDARYTADGVLRDGFLDKRYNAEKDRFTNYDRFDYEPPLQFSLSLNSSYFREVRVPRSSVDTREAADQDTYR